MLSEHVSKPWPSMILVLTMNNNTLFVYRSPIFNFLMRNIKLSPLVVEIYVLLFQFHDWCGLIIFLSRLYSLYCGCFSSSYCYGYVKSIARIESIRCMCGLALYNYMLQIHCLIWHWWILSLIHPLIVPKHSRRLRLELNLRILYIAMLC
jgi:hypothetical protein